jgi:uncharacterized protein (TIGR03435 family)
MVARLLLFLIVFSMSALPRQNETHIKAGDDAPEIDWSKAVHSPDLAQYYPSLVGRYTVLQFLPTVTANTQIIGLWNDLVTKFADQPVQFVWIASEPWSSVQPFLRQHPIKGWLLIDEGKTAAHAYGCEMGDTAIINSVGKIIGFTSFLLPPHLSAILDGKAVAIPSHTDDEQISKLLTGGKIRLETEPARFPPELPAKPDIPPSYEVRISPSKAKGTEASIGPDFWIQKGFDLKAIVSMVYERDPSRVLIPSQLDNEDKFDFVVVPPNPEDGKTIHHLVQRAIEKYFKVWAAVESQPTEVYVMTAAKGETPQAKTGTESMGGGFVGSSSFEFAVPVSSSESPDAMKKAIQEITKRPENIGLSSISASNASIDDFRKALEDGLGRPIIDETGLTGSYDLDVHGKAKTTAEFIRMLREQTGLALTPATRNIELLTLHLVN